MNSEVLALFTEVFGTFAHDLWEIKCGEGKVYSQEAYIDYSNSIREAAKLINKTDKEVSMTTFNVGELVLYQNGDNFELGKVKELGDDGAFVYYNGGDTAAKTPFDCLHKLTNRGYITGTSLGRERFSNNLGVSRYCPGLYSVLLAGHISSPSNLELQNSSVRELHETFPRYSLFMDLHLGKSFSEEVLRSNIKAISEMPTRVLLESLGEDMDGTPMFYITVGDLVSKYNIQLEETMGG